MAEYRFANVIGLRSGLRISREGERNVTENGDLMLPAWTTVDATTHYDTKLNAVASTWTLAINTSPTSTIGESLRVNMANIFSTQARPELFVQQLCFASEKGAKNAL